MLFRTNFIFLFFILFRYDEENKKYSNLLIFTQKLTTERASERSHIVIIVIIISLFPNGINCVRVIIRKKTTMGRRIRKVRRRGKSRLLFPLSFHIRDF